MRILFVLPAPVRVPSGGAAVVYRHAQGLVSRGHEVTVAAPRRMDGVAGRLRAVATQVQNRLHQVEERPLHLVEGVDTVEVAAPRNLNVKGFDSVIATGHQTASWVYRAVQGRGQRGVYFVQGDERYQNPRAEATWALPFARVAVSTWLAELLESHAAPVEAVIPNAVEPEVFRLTQSIENRDRRVIALYHRNPVKGPDTLIAALHRIRALQPGVHVDVISARPPAHRFPDGATVHVRPSPDDLSRLFNQASVCLHTSRLEGWGLVPMEAAACGCAVVATASRGISEFLVADRSMRLVPVGDADAVAAQAVELLCDSEARIRVARAGVEDVARFSWDDSTSRFEDVLLSLR